MIKKLIFSLSFLFAIFYSNAQGQIISITVDPPSPTTADSVTVYVDLQFSSGSCFPDSQLHSTNGNNTSATSHHCLGMLTVICPYTDTFELGYLQAGVHQFDFVLTSGGAPSPCTPGIVPDDQDGLSFTVTSAVGIAKSFQNNLVQVFPNPASTSISFLMNDNLVGENAQLQITDATGKIIFLLEGIQISTIILNDLNLANGLYFYAITNKEIQSNGKFIIEK